MIAHLSGTLLSKQPNLVIVDVGGVGYEITIPLSTFYDLGEETSPVALRNTTLPSVWKTSRSPPRPFVAEAHSTVPPGCCDSTRLPSPCSWKR